MRPILDELWLYTWLICTIRTSIVLQVDHQSRRYYAVSWYSYRDYILKKLKQLLLECTCHIRSKNLKNSHALFLYQAVCRVALKFKIIRNTYAGTSLCSQFVLPNSSLTDRDGSVLDNGLPSTIYTRLCLLLIAFKNRNSLFDNSMSTRLTSDEKKC